MEIGFLIEGDEQMEHSIPERGVWTSTIASIWEDGFVSGNGIQGAILYGEPTSETWIGNHCRLYLPQGNDFSVPNLAPHLEETRKIIRTQGYEEALSFQYEKAKELGYSGLTMSDPYHPGFHLTIATNHSTYKNYKRSLDYRTGEIVISYENEGASYMRRGFVSRCTNKHYYWLSPGKYTIQLAKYENPYMHQDIHVEAQMIHSHVSYTKGDGGYDISISLQGMPTTKPVENGYIVSNKEPILLVMEITPYKQENERSIIRRDIHTTYNYEEELERHLSIHQEMFERVQLDIAQDNDRLKDIWSIVDKAKQEKTVPPEWIEKMYDAGRYMYICSAGELTPNLQGIWTGTSHPAWSGDFTFDTNVQLSIAGALSSGLREGLEGYFRLIKELIPGFRENAKKYYGCRGIMASAHSSNTGNHVHWNPDWPLHMWTCGAGWLGHWYMAYYRFTGDTHFLREEVLPYLEEVALFYEDFLVKDQDGTYRFTPSYSAENGCADNATQDIAVAKEVLSNLIEAYKILQLSSNKLVVWKEIINHLPAYQINDEGALKEWLIPEKDENYNHRHFSHLYPIFQSREFNEVSDPTLWQAAKTAFDKRLDAWLLNEEGDTSSTHGRMHSALCATQFSMPDLIEEIFHLLIEKDCFFSSLMMSHYNNREIFNVDGNGALPQVVHEMLIDYSNEYLTILGALPSILPKGKIQGVRLMNQMIVHEMTWDINKQKVVISIESMMAQPIILRLPLFRQSEHHYSKIYLQKNKPEEISIHLGRY